MKSKLIFAVVSCISLNAISTHANAAFWIENDTKNSLSFAIKNTCSSEFGTIKPHDHNLISEDKFFSVCKNNPHHCIAKIYTGDACSGKHTATMVLDTDFGFKSVTKAGPYTYTSNINNLIISEK